MFDSDLDNSINADELVLDIACGDRACLSIIDLSSSLQMLSL